MSEFYTVTIELNHSFEEQVSSILDLISPESYAYESPFQKDRTLDSRFCLYFDSEEKARQTKKILSPLLEPISPEMILTIAEGDDADWQNEWKKFFQPIPIGEKLIILPAWEEVDAPQDKAVVLIDPGMAFGNGGHATTKGCLVFLEKLVEPNMTILDFGTGSGILAIAAHKLGANYVDAIDNDSVAIEIAAKNCQQNRCEDSIHLMVGESGIIPSRHYDLIVANITADVIMEHFDKLIDQQPKLRHLILSGIIMHKKPALDEYLAQRNIHPSELWHENGWFTYLIKTS
ncbi:MAG TPA: 50S ribosomal protein L11 methyltransferase [Candidatus Margulisbacteria bacterium]|nr:MAG: ribosomal protein L11 methyltransferase [Candidatus Margulisbacteria bacterium GWD2_39_127]HAR61896.1 50S ribosomal protein L11 methyltransferase [Candidatus Margulisiibacteriota bacterium]